MATLKQKAAIEKVVENHGNVSRAMLEVGYDPTTAKNPKNLTESKAWVELMEQHIPDADLAKWHRELAEQKRVDFFVFSKAMEDEEIIAHVKEAGFDVITVRYSDKGKMAFYSVPDAMAKGKALDMAYKLKGKNAPEKSQSINLDVKVDATDQKAKELAIEYEEKLRLSML